MKIFCLIFIVCTLCFAPSLKSQNCSNWLNLPNQPSFVRIGDLDITGNQLTVEASFVRTAPWAGTDLLQGDLVSKHEDPNDCNYLLRPGSAEITTTNGYFKTPTICAIELNKTYHAAMVYDGTTLKFYRNGFLMSQIPASGNLIQNDWLTQIGLYFNQITQENFIGYINEVRIWNVARSQSQIQTYMNQSLPSPQTTTGLLAYYTFDNLLNKQGNSAWDGALGGSASINQTNPNCTFVIDSCAIMLTPCNNLQKIDFSFQQNMCSPNSVQFSTLLPGVQSYQWNFGNGQTNNSSQNPGITYSSFGSYPVKLFVQYPNGCTDSVEKIIIVESLFDNTLIENNDTTICLGDSVFLNTGNVVNYCWQSSSGSPPSYLNQYVKPTSNTTYFLTSQVTGNNLIANGDFSAGNTGFTSQYVYNSGSGFTDGVYNVGSNISAWHPGMSNCNDHTSGNGNMMMVNGSTQLNINVWSQTVPVQPNTNYAFSTWLQTITTVNPAQLQFSINGVPVGNVFNASTQSCVWQQFNTSWNSGNITSATISILNMNQVFSGNDFALDDIFFGEVNTKTDSFTVNVTGLCDSVKINGIDKICSRTDTLTYSIYRSPNCTQQFSLQVDPAFADIISQTATAIKLVFKQNGTTAIKVSYANNCKTVVDSLVVNIRFSPAAINFGPDITTCRDTLLTLNAGNGFSSYTWQNSSSDSTFIVNVPGVYYVTAQNLCGVQFSDTLRLIRSAVTPFIVQPLQATVCIGDSVQFAATGGTVYSWSPAVNFSNPTFGSPKAVVNSTQNFSVFISDPLCIRDTTIIIPVTATPGASINLLKSNDVNCGNDSAVLVANGGISYNWSPNLYITRNNGDRITVKPSQNTTYTVTGTNASGCKGKDSVTVAFMKQGEQKLFVPTAFTPNGDGLNDLFRPVFVGPAAKYDLKVYNRWGQLVFHSKTPGQGWNGIYKGALQRSDVFVFYITAEGGCNGKFEQRGTIALIR